MPEQETKQRAKRAKERGEAPSTQAGEFVREEMHHIREGKHGARSTRQAIAIGLSKARRSGVELEPPPPGTASESTRRHAERDLERSHRGTQRVSSRRSRATTRALEREGSGAASHEALSDQAHRSARARGRSSRSSAAHKATRTKGPKGRKAAARKAARTRSARGR